MSKSAMVTLGNRPVGEGFSVYVIAEIGINHNGSVAIAKKLIDAAALAGCDAVKFQKRTPEIATPKDEWNVERDTPWGNRMTYIEYRRRIEFSEAQFDEIARHCESRSIQWFASAWDEPSVDFLERYDNPAIKIPSAAITDLNLLRKARAAGRPLMISTGMSTTAEIDAAIGAIGAEKLLVAHTTSAYPCPVEELNLRMLATLKRAYPDCPIGYSGHEVGLATTWAAVALGATFVERHITLDRSLPGSDHAASVEIGGLLRLVTNIRDIEKAVGDGVKRVYASEMKPMKRLRRVRATEPAEAARQEG
jgi:N-acetylneuraminate synthase